MTFLYTTKKLTVNIFFEIYIILRGVEYLIDFEKLDRLPFSWRAENSLAYSTSGLLTSLSPFVSFSFFCSITII